MGGFERVMRIAALALLAASSAAAPRASRAQDTARPLVVALELRGVQSIDASELQDGLATRVTRCRSILYTPLCLASRSPTFAQRFHLDPVELRRDILRIRLFYWKRGFRDATVTSRTTAARGGVKVWFDIEEGTPTIAERIDVVPAEGVLPPATIRGALLLRSGDPLDLVSLDSTRAVLRDELWERGYADARVDLDTSRVSNEANRGPVTLTLHPGRVATVDSIQIEGNSAIPASTIRRLLQLTPGELYKRSALLYSQRELYLSGLFSEVEAKALPTLDSAKTVRIQVREAKLNRLELNSGFTNADFLQFEASFTRYHFLGGARRLTVRATASNLLARQLNGAGILYDVTQGAIGIDRDPFLEPTWAASLDFAQPWAFGPRNQLGASIFTHRRSVPGIVTDRGAGAAVALTRHTSTRSDATLGYTWEASTIEASDVYFCVAVGVCVESAIAVIARRNPLAPVALVGRLDTSDDPFSPTRGVRVAGELEHASATTGSSFAYQRLAFDASVFRHVARRAVVAARARVGLVRALGGRASGLGFVDDAGAPIIHPRKLFFSGGSQSVRGYGENQLGPRVLTIDPAILTDTMRAQACRVNEVADGSCDPNIDGVRAGAFVPRPLGGSALAEASVELRFPLSTALGLSGALFLDGAIVGTRRFTDLLGATATMTPGFGVRFATPVGPVRLDLGVRPRVVERLPVITQVADADGSLRLVTLTTARRFDAAESTGGFLAPVLSRLTLHLAIGPAF